ncbi:MAG: hypothetical protein K1X75_16410 [Leptospirales bacterium]|nr:hypothetical protein [Leptospirales bacterium]
MPAPYSVIFGRLKTTTCSYEIPIVPTIAIAMQSFVLDCPSIFRRLFPVSASSSASPIQKASDLLFFDNLALYYVVERTPPEVLARVFQSGDSRLAGAMLGILTPKQREIVHQLMAANNDGDRSRNEQASQALVILAGDLLLRGFLRRDGRRFYGVPREEQLQPGAGAYHP